MPTGLFRNLIRASVVFGFWLVLLLVVLSFEIINAASHAGALWSGFEALGTDQTPLTRIPVVGSVLAMFGGDVSLSEVLAIAIAGMELLLAFVVAELLVGLIKLPFAALRHRFVQNIGWLEIDWAAILLNAVFLASLATVLAVLIAFDRELYLYRANVDAIEAAAQAWTSSGPEWLKSLGQQTSLLAANAYTVLFLGGAVALAMLVHRLDNAFERMSESWAQLWLRVVHGAPAPQDAGDARQQLLYGYDGDGQPVFDPNQPIAYDPDGTPVAPESAAPAEAVRFAPEPGTTAAAGREDGAGNDPAPETTHPHAAPAGATEERVSVITANGTREMPRSQVLGNPKQYRLDLGTNQWWERAVWEEVHGNLADPPPRREAT
ncbi:MAG: hypothetical protein ACREFK_03795 [Stellaceae bacterium]